MSLWVPNACYCTKRNPNQELVFARLGGEVTSSGVENVTQTWYFAFQVTQVFLITTFSSGAASVVVQIWNDPTMAAYLLAKNLPKASNFYLSYFVLFGLVTSATTVLNVSDLLMSKVVGRLLDTTPRKKYERHMSLTGIGWGSEYPKFTNLGVIGMLHRTFLPLYVSSLTNYSHRLLLHRPSCSRLRNHRSIPPLRGLQV